MTGSNIPFDFLHEQGIEFDFAGDGSSSVPITSSLPASTSGRLDEHEDLELSSSLLTMSLDKDIPMDEMALSAGEKSLLALRISNLVQTMMNLHLTLDVPLRGWDRGATKPLP